MDLRSSRSVSPTKETELSLDLDQKRSSASYASPPSSAGLSRTPTLSWQRRPTSQGPGPRSRPLSMVAAENAAARTSIPPAEATSPDHTVSRDQISQALGSKDPAWFRQTADRGANSAAYRKPQSEDPDTLEALSGRAQLPGMSRPTSTEPERDTPRTRPRSHTGSRAGSPLLSSMTEAQKLGPPADIQAGQDGTGSGRSSPTRPASPTKGMGGFVQSAMMKRTDSVKRWSVTTAGLQRGNPVSRQSFDNKSGSTSPAADTISRPGSRARESLSRPGSSHAKDPVASTVDATPTKENESVTPKPEISMPKVLKPEDDGEKTPPTSPSRTMDPRRWSPTKGSSWLDAALKAPESPKPKPAAVSNQPAWMVELNKAKAARANNAGADVGRAGTAIKKHEVKTGGLVRPAPPGMTVKPPGLSSIRSPPIGVEKPLTPGLRSAGLNKSPVLERPSPPPGVNKPLTPGLRSGSLEKQSQVVDKPSPGIEEPERRGSVTSPVLGKDTPPRNDFRTSLRPRGTTLGQADKVDPISRSRGATVGQSDRGGEPVNELANVFGKLRKATTQNYVAPDELKGNIMRGKAGLNITGGPRPYEKKDEFKDAILKKKDEFKQAKQEGRAVVPNAKPPQEQPLPEGLARRATISRAKSISHSRDSSAVKSPSAESPGPPWSSSHSRDASTVKSPPADSSSKTLDSPNPTDTSAATWPSTESSSKALVSPRTAESHLPSPGIEVGQEKSGSREEKPEPATFQPDPPKEKPTPATFQRDSPTEQSVPGRLPNKLGGALADRFNPALAGLLARGPPGMGGAGAKSPGASSGTGVSDAGNEPGQGPQLTHLTKNRVRGPRRKTPASVTASKMPAPASSAATEPEPATTPAVDMVEEESPAPPSPVREEPNVVEQPREDPKDEPKSELVTSPKPSMTSPVELQTEQLRSPMAEDKPRSSGVISLVDSSQRRLAEQTPISTGSRIALVNSSKSDVAPGSPKKIHAQVAAIAAKTQPVVEEKKFEEPPPRSPSPRKLDARRMSKFLDETSQSPPKHTPEPIRTPSPLKRGFGGPPSPPKPSDNEKVDSQPAVSVSNGTSMFGRSLTPVKSQKQEDKPVEKRIEKPLPTPLDLRPSTPNKALPAKPLPAEPKDEAVPSPIASPVRSPSKSGSEVSTMLKDFFGNERPKREYRADAAEILMNRPQPGALVQTQSAQLFQITEQGKRVPVPAHHERVLFEREMYICSHSFTNAARKKVQEVYFWAGDEVAPSVVEDAQVFVGREAKSLGGTLIKMRQGKETAEFIQALGGIVIVRRGSSNKYDSLASNMLCGRNYLGQIVFDEVDFAPLTLCSGFPYIISQSGQCYLWKGKGAGVDELSCARLIGMDSALMGELVEVEEGKEPETFWALFGGQKKMSSADHWRLKPSYDKYCGRLFCSDAADRRQVCRRATPPLPTNTCTLETSQDSC